MGGCWGVVFLLVEVVEELDGVSKWRVLRGCRLRGERKVLCVIYHLHDKRESLIGERLFVCVCVCVSICVCFPSCLPPLPHGINLHRSTR